MDKKKLVIIVVALAVVVGLVAASVFWNKGGEQAPAATGNQVSGQPAEPVSTTREAAPKNMVVPEVGSNNVPENVAVPTAVSPVRAGADVNNRIFGIVAEGNKFSPDTVVVKKGDEVKINLTAVDKDYAFTQPDYGFNVVVRKGEKKLIQFMGSAEGKFKFYCGACGGPDKGPVGYVIVMPKG